MKLITANVFTSLYFSFILLTLSAVSKANVVNPPTLEPLWQTDRFNGPESVIYDERTQLLFVSNVNGAPNEKNGQGFISIMSVEGKVLQKQWVKGLHAPKGLAIVGNLLYVADIDQLVEIDINHGRIIKRHVAPQAIFLNDVVANINGDVYVSDMLTQSIYQLASGQFSLWLKDDALESPNGLYIEDGQLVVGSWGNMTDGFSTEIAGHLKTVSLDTKAITSLGNGSPVGNLDGVESDGKGNFYVTDWLSGGLHLINKQGNAKKIIALPQGSADLDVVLEKNLLIIPMMMDGNVFAYRIQ